MKITHIPYHTLLLTSIIYGFKSTHQKNTGQQIYWCRYSGFVFGGDAAFFTDRKQGKKVKRLYVERRKH